MKPKHANLQEYPISATFGGCTDSPRSSCNNVWASHILLTLLLLRRGKSLLLLEQIASDLGWPDSSLHHELREGFRITGMSKPSEVFDLNFKSPDLANPSLRPRPSL